MDWIQTAVEAAVRFVLQALVFDLGKAVMGLLSRLLVSPIGLLSDLDLAELIRYARNLAWLILPLILLRHGITLAQDRAEGAATESVENFVRRAVMATIGVASTTLITGWIMQFADSIIQTFLNAGTGLDPLSMLFGVPREGASFSLLFLILTVVIGFLVLVIQRAILNASLAVTMAIGPIAATSLAWGDSALWNTWIRETVSIIATYVMQTVMLWWLLRKVGSWGVDTFDSKLLVLGILIVMVKTPSVLRQWTYSAGGGAALVGGGASVARMAVMYRMLAATPVAVTRGGAGGDPGPGRQSA